MCLFSFQILTNIYVKLIVQHPFYWLENWWLWKVVFLLKKMFNYPLQSTVNGGRGNKHLIQYDNTPSPHFWNFDHCSQGGGGELKVMDNWPLMCWCINIDTRAQIVPFLSNVVRGSGGGECETPLCVCLWLY